MKNDIMSKLYNLFLIIVLFTLPVTEGLKQISLILFVLVGIYICVKEKKQFKFDTLVFFADVINSNFMSFFLFSISIGSASLTITLILFILLLLSNLNVPDLFLYMGLMLNIDKTKLQKQ